MESEIFGQHISRKFNEELESLRSQVSTMGGLVERQLTDAIEAIVSADSQLGLQVASRDVQVNQIEVEIDEECGRILATRAPAAADLRLIVAVIKAITDLERIGDEAQRIGILAARLATEKQPADRYDELKTLADHVLDMLHDALDAFSRLDAEDALKVVEEDKIVDEEYDMISRQCITLMMEDPRTIHRFMDVSWAARALERIGDHAKNISEYVIYLVQGKDVRHTQIEAVREQVERANKILK
ncbi:MAG: phosphate signaling complex protein PhoU [Gammaproteobacteria bacterium]|jgi:phosphate transport system protein|nr:phosphate signaling complex protein PhoU [Gammaproteobacteria bacterium]